MKKFLAFCGAVFLISFTVGPAKADMNIYLSSYKSSGHHHYKKKNHKRYHRYYRQHRQHRYNKHRRHRYHRSHYAPQLMPAFFWAHLLSPPTRHVVVEKRVVQYIPQYAPRSAPLQATPLSANYVGSSGQLCREYQAPASVSGSFSMVYGTACRQSDGSWRVVN